MTHEWAVGLFFPKPITIRLISDQKRLSNIIYSFQWIITQNSANKDKKKKVTNKIILSPVQKFMSSMQPSSED